MIGTFMQIVEKAKEGGAKKRAAIPLLKEQDLNLLQRLAEEGFIVPLLIGNAKETEIIVGKAPLASLEYEIVDVKDSAEALRTAVAFTREGRADILMQGGVDQKSFMGAVLKKETGLMKGKLASYVSVLQAQKSERLILVTDTFVNDMPGIVEKQIIIENALVLAGILGMKEPKIAAIAAIEQVNPNIQSTVDAAVLSKMSERKQFGKAIIEGPLDMDCALSRVAAARKGIESIVTGNVDVYVVPEIETGYLLVQALVFFGRMKTAGILLGTAKPVIPNMPFISDENRVVELALAALISRREADNA
ncbi:MAG: phosphate acyltransferase [Syntrophales bacterium]